MKVYVTDRYPAGYFTVPDKTVVLPFYAPDGIPSSGNNSQVVMNVESYLCCNTSPEYAENYTKIEVVRDISDAQQPDPNELHKESSFGLVCYILPPNTQLQEAVYDF